MARNLLNLSSKHPDKDIVAVVGAGHVEGIKEILDKPAYEFSFSYEV
jgi:pheromone shutdown protein TraB